MNSMIEVEKKINLSLNETYYIENLYDFPILLIVILSCLYGIISLLSIVGNLSVIIIVSFCHHMQTTTNYFIANLAVADIIIGMLVAPFHFQAALLQRWVLPQFMCAFFPFLEIFAINLSVFSLTVVAFDRYRAVMHPLKAKTIKIKKKLIIFFIWIFSLTLSIPYAIVFDVAMVFDPDTGTLSKPVCQNVRITNEIWQFFNFSIFLAEYIVPLCLITIFYIKIGLKLKQSEAGRDAARLTRTKEVICNTLKITIIFTVCWLPYQLYNGIQEFLPEINKYINLIWCVFQSLAMSNSCCNPFIYAIYNEKFNVEFRKLWACCFKAQRSNAPEAPLPNDA